MKKKIPDSQRFSIITDDLRRCYVCGAFAGIELHEIFFGSHRRERSKEYGLVVPLCDICHRGTNGVHGKNGKELNMKLKAIGQTAFENHYPDLDFITIFGKGGYK